MLEQLLDTYTSYYDDYNITTDWGTEDTANVGLKVQGRELQGTIKITPDCFNLDFDMPWVFLPFKPKIKKTVDQEMQRWLANF